MEYAAVQVTYKDITEMSDVDFKTIEAAIDSNSIQKMLCEPCVALGYLFYEDDDWIILLIGQVAVETQRSNVLTIPKKTIIKLVKYNEM